MRQLIAWVTSRYVLPWGIWYIYRYLARARSISDACVSAVNTLRPHRLSNTRTAASQLQLLKTGGHLLRSPVQYSSDVKTIMTTTASICPDGRLPTGKAAFLLLALATSSCRWSTCNGFVPSASWIASRGVAGLRVGCRPGPWARCKNPAGATAVRKRPGWRCSSTPVPVVGTGERWIGKYSGVESGIAWHAIPKQFDDDYIFKCSSCNNTYSFVYSWYCPPFSYIKFAIGGPGDWNGTGSLPCTAGSERIRTRGSTSIFGNRSPHFTQTVHTPYRVPLHCAVWSITYYLNRQFWSLSASNDLPEVSSKLATIGWLCFVIWLVCSLYYSTQCIPQQSNQISWQKCEIWHIKLSQDVEAIGHRYEYEK